MSGTSLVSVIIPIFNVRSELIDRCLTSVLNQSHAALEVLMVDDGSDESTAAYLDRCTDLDPRVTVLHQANLGVSAARNAGLRKARGEYVCFVDSDDYVLGEYIAAALDVAFRTRADAVFGGISILQGDRTFHWRSGERDRGNPLVLEGSRLAEPRALALADSPSPRADSAMLSITNIHGALYTTFIARCVQFRAGVSQAEDRLYNFDVLGAAQRTAFCCDPWYVYDQTVEGSATKTFGSGGVAQLAPVLDALAPIANNPCHYVDDPSANALIRRSAASALTNYLKLVATVAAKRVPTWSALLEVKYALHIHGVVDALWRAPATNVVDRSFLFFARRRLAAPLLLLAKMSARLRRA
jgi:hypothetical protein